MQKGKLIDFRTFTKYLKEKEYSMFRINTRSYETFTKVKIILDRLQYTYLEYDEEPLYKYFKEDTVFVIYNDKSFGINHISNYDNKPGMMYQLRELHNYYKPKRI